MGNRLGIRKKEPTVPETVAPEEKAAEAPAAACTQQAEAPEVPQQVAVGGQAAAEPEVPAEVAATEVKADDVVAVTEEPLAPVEPLVSASEPEPLVSASEPEPPAPEPVAEPEPVVEVEPTPEAAPVPEPEPIPEPEPVQEPEEVVEAVAEPALPVPAEESLPEPAPLSAPLVDLGGADEMPEPIDADIPAPVDTEPLDVPESEECQDSVEAAVISTLVEPESLVELETEANDAANLEQLIDVNEENVSGLLQKLQLTGNDQVSDLISSDVKMSDDAPIIDMSVSTEHM